MVLIFSCDKKKHAILKTFSPVELLDYGMTQFSIRPVAKGFKNKETQGNKKQ